MLTAWRYDSDTNEVAVPRSYDPANGRSSKIQACKTCREKKTRCTGDGLNACDRCQCKGLTCEYTTCKSKKSPRLSKACNSSISKPRRPSVRKNSLLSPSAVTHVDYDSSDTLSDKTASPLPCQMGSMDVFEVSSGHAPDNFAIDPLLLQDFQQGYGRFEQYTGEYVGAGGDADMQYLAAGNEMYHGTGQFQTPYAHGHHGEMRQYTESWLPNGLA